MTENLAGRGEGLKGQSWNVEQILVYIWQCFAGESSEQEYPYAKFANSEAGKRLRVEIAALEAAAPPGTDGICPICYHPSAALATPSPQAPANDVLCPQLEQSATTAEEPGIRSAGNLHEAAQEILKPHWPSVRNMEENEARQREVERIVRILRGSPRKVGEDGDSHLSGRIAARLDEYKFIAHMIAGVEEEDWYKRRIANLESMYAASSVPVGEQK